MDTTIFYYTGTGNSLWVARRLSSLPGNVNLVSISEWMKLKKPIETGTIGIVFPVHIWGVPSPVVKFVDELKGYSFSYIFAVAVDADQVANTLVQLKNIFKKNGMILSSGFEIKLPSNYIPWGDVEPREKQEQKFSAAEKKLSDICRIVKNRESRPVEKGPLWQRVIFTMIYKMSSRRVPEMDRSFWVDEKCNHCGICARVCPAENIVMVDEKPVWNHHCEQCLACIHWCPQKSIQYGNKTQAYKRYHHPEIELKDMLKR